MDQPWEGPEGGLRMAGAREPADRTLRACQSVFALSPFPGGSGAGCLMFVRNLCLGPHSLPVGA